VRAVWAADLPGMAGTHLRPKDLPGAIVSLDCHGEGITAVSIAGLPAGSAGPAEIGGVTFVAENAAAGHRDRP